MEKRFLRVKEAVHRGIEAGVFPCAAVEIGDVNGPVWRYTEGLRQVKPEPLPVNEETIFDMASVSKVLSATMVALTMMEDGLLSPVDHMGLFWEGLPEKAASITVKQLMTHTSGLPGGYSIVGFPKENIGEAILRSEDVFNDPRSYEAGSKVMYACLGFIVLGELLEKLGGKPLDVLAQERVFGPLGMTHTGYRPVGDNIAATSLKDPVKGIVHDYNARYLVRPVGNAGVFSTLEDCGRFARMLLREGEPVVSAPTMAMARKNYTPFSEFGRAMGFYLAEQTATPGCQLCSPAAFGHTGWTGTNVISDPELGMYTVVLTNRTCVEKMDPDAILRYRRYINNAAVACFTKKG